MPSRHYDSTVLKSIDILSISRDNLVIKSLEESLGITIHEIKSKIKHKQVGPDLYKKMELFYNDYLRE